MKQEVIAGRKADEGKNRRQQSLRIGEYHTLLSKIKRRNRHDGDK